MLTSRICVALVGLLMLSVFVGTATAGDTAPASCDPDLEEGTYCTAGPRGCETVVYVGDEPTAHPAVYQTCW